MADRSKIEWTDASWNPVTGCTPARLANGQVSPGCDNCYARREHNRRHKAHLAGKKMAPQYGEPFNVVQCHSERLDQPLRWTPSQRVFVCSGADLFHEDVPISFIAEIFGRMACATVACGKRHKHVDECWTGDPHMFIILTKRAERMRYELTEGILDYMGNRWPGDSPLGVAAEVGAWPLPNVHVGVSVENQAAADERIPLLLQTPAAVRFVSYEPALGPVKFRSEWLAYPGVIGDFRTHEGKQVKFERLDSVICGGESGPNARPMHPDWARKVRDDCAAAGVPFFFKQHGEWIHTSQYTKVIAGQKPFAEERMFYEFDQQDAFFRVGKKAAGRILDGCLHDELPGSAALRRGEPGSKITTENIEATKC